VRRAHQMLNAALPLDDGGDVMMMWHWQDEELAGRGRAGEAAAAELRPSTVSSGYVVVVETADGVVS